MLASPPALESKAIHLPSGDQRGVPGRLPKNDNCTGLEPSASHTQTSFGPVLSDSKAIFDPSGEMLGESCCRDETMTLLALGVDACKSSRQIFSFVTPCPYTRRCAAELTAMSPASWPNGSFCTSPGRVSEVSQRLPDAPLNTMRLPSPDQAIPHISPSSCAKRRVPPSLSRCAFTEKMASVSRQTQAR